MNNYELKKQQKDEERAKVSGAVKTKKIFKIIVGLGVVVAIGAGVWFGISQIEPIPQEDIIARRGVHWHPNVSITILGRPYTVDANIGIGVRVSEVHTHDTTGVVHYEPVGLVTKDYLHLGILFEKWGKEFSNSCVFEFCNGDEGTLSMRVNGAENFDFEDYIVQDNDRIEIIFE